MKLVPCPVPSVLSLGAWFDRPPDHVEEVVGQFDRKNHIPASCRDRRPCIRTFNSTTTPDRAPVERRQHDAIITTSRRAITLDERRQGHACMRAIQHARSNRHGRTARRLVLSRLLNDVIDRCKRAHYLVNRYRFQIGWLTPDVGCTITGSNRRSTISPDTGIRRRGLGTMNAAAWSSGRVRASGRPGPTR